MEEAPEDSDLQFKFLRVHSDVVRPCLVLRSAAALDQSGLARMLDTWHMQPPALILHVIGAHAAHSGDVQLSREVDARLQQGFYKLLSGANMLVVSNGHRDNVLATCASKAALALNNELEYVMRHPEFIKEHQDDVGLPKDISFSLVSVTDMGALGEPDSTSVASECTLMQLAQPELDARQMHFVCLRTDDQMQLATFRATFTVQTTLAASAMRLPSSPLSDGDDLDSSGTRHTKNVLHCRPLVVCICSHLVTVAQLVELRTLLQSGMPGLVLYDTSKLGMLLKDMVDVFLAGQLSASAFESLCRHYVRSLDTLRHYDTLDTSHTWAKVALDHMLAIASAAPLGMLSMRSVAQFQFDNVDEEIVNYSAIKKSKSQCSAQTSDESFVALTMLAILMKRPELAKLVWSRCCNPIPLAIIAGAMCAALADDTHEWFYYQKELVEMKRDFEQLSVDLLLLAHGESSTKHCSYDVLCRRFEQFGGFTATHLAYVAENRAFLAQEICQRWVTRSLYGDVQLVLDRWAPLALPAGVKALLSVVLLVPIRFWFCLRPTVANTIAFDNSNRRLEELVFEGDEREALVSTVGAGSRSRVLSHSDTPCSVTNLRKETNAHQERAMAEGATGVRERLSRESSAPQRVLSTQPQRRPSVTAPSSMLLSDLDKTSPDATFTDVTNNTTFAQRSLVADPGDTWDGCAPSTAAKPGMHLDWLALPAFSIHKDKVFVPVTFFLEGLSRKSALARAVPLWRLVVAFYRTPVAKYWLSLVSRVLFLVLFGLAVSMPGCGRVELDLLVWLWALVLWSESAFVLRARLATVRLSRLRNEAMDVLLIGILLVLMLVFKIVSNTHGLHMAEPFVGRCVAALFLLYMCYATLFIYIPMSATLGPLMVRVKLMVLRDFVNYLLLVCIVMASSAIVLHSVAFPDFSWSPLLWHKAFSWAWFSLFTTDLSVIQESDTCAQKHVLPGSKMMSLTPAELHAHYCGQTSGYESEDCARQSWVAYAALIQYFVILKLISWPLLFALFAKTAKEVDDEADNIWKYQFYSLVTSFAERPVLPAPLSPLLLLARCTARCCSALAAGARRLYRCCCGCCGRHPPRSQVDGERQRKPANYDEFWRRLARDAWRQHVRHKHMQKLTDDRDKQQVDEVDADIRKTLCLDALKIYPLRTFDVEAGLPVKGQYKVGGATVLQVPADCVQWSKYVPNYNPVDFSLPAHCLRMRRSFTSLLPGHSVDTGDNWQCARMLWPLANLLSPLQCANILPGRQPLLLRPDGQVDSGTFDVSPDGLPRNPVGRIGIQGRGALPRFGPNRFVLLVVLDHRRENILLFKEPFVSRPSGLDSDAQRLGLPVCGLSKSFVDETQLRRASAARAARLLLAAFASDGAQSAVDATHRALVAIARGVDGQHDRAACTMVSSALTVTDTELATDNAWVRLCAWAVQLGGAAASQPAPGYSWLPLQQLQHLTDFEMRAVAAATAT